MAECNVIVSTLKQLLKRNNKTYMDVAEQLHLSEASVKKMFSENRLSLDRLDKICELLDLEISDLIGIMNEGRAAIHSLSHEQEQEIVGDKRLFLVAVSVLHGLAVDKIVDTYDISRKECLAHLRRLEALKVVRLLPDYRVKLIVSKSFSWIPDGPIHRFFHEHLQQEFFSSRFNGSEEKLILLSGLASETTSTSLIKKMEKLALEFGELVDDDWSIPLEMKKGTTLVLAYRPWLLNAFKQLSRKRKATPPASAQEPSAS